MGAKFGKSYKVQRRLLDRKKFHIPPPLQNKNETCYMNAIVQALGSCTKMKEDLEQLRIKCQSHQLKLFVELLNALNASVAQREFDDFISLYGWCKQGQQDSYEVMSFIINSIYNELKEIRSKDISSEDNIFPGVITMSSKTSCCCESKNRHILRDLALHLPLVNGKGNQYDIQEMIRAMFKSDEIDDKCDKCKTSQTLSLTIEGQPPRTICLHIQANRYDPVSETMTKPKYTLDFPYTLEFYERSYELVSFLDHSGEVSVGHYMAYRKVGSEWFRVNDDIINHLPKVNNPKAHCENPYVLFYETTSNK